MARLRASITTEGEIALTAATAKTILQVLAPTNQRLAIRAWSVNFDGVSATEQPVQVDVLRQTSAGTMTGATEVKEDGLGSETIQATGQHTATGTEPTAGDILRRYNVHPQTGIEVRYGPDEELIVPGGGRIGIRCTAPAAVNVNGFLSWEE